LRERERERERAISGKFIGTYCVQKCAVLIPAATDCGTVGTERQMILVFGSLNA